MIGILGATTGLLAGIGVGYGLALGFRPGNGPYNPPNLSRKRYDKSMDNFCNTQSVSQFLSSGKGIQTFTYNSTKISIVFDFWKV